MTISSFLPLPYRSSSNSPAAKAIPQRTKDRVLKAARKFNYRANFIARSLSLKRGFTIGVLLPELSEGYAAAVMSGVEDQLLKEGYFYFGRAIPAAPT